MSGVHSIKRILVPTDFTACADGALLHALYVARMEGATVSILHVAEQLAPAMQGKQYPHMQTYYDRMIVALQRSMRATLPDLHHEVEVFYQTRIGRDIPGGILNHAKEHDIDLIVMGTMGQRQESSVLMGSSTTKVVRKATCHVLSVGPTALQDPELVKRILVPIDFSEASRYVFKFAQSIVERIGGELILLHVIAPEEQDSKEEKLAQLRQYLPPENDGNQTYRVCVGSGNPLFEIPAFAHRHHVNLVVISYHERRDVEAPFIGCVVEQVVQMAPCPVFRIKPKVGEGTVNQSSGRKARSRTQTEKKK